MSNRRLHALAVASGLLAALVVVTSGQPALAQKGKARHATFEVYKDKGGAYRWRYVASNGTVMATPGQSFKAKADAVNSISSIQKGVSGDKLKTEIYEDKKKEHRWRLKAANGEILAVSSDGYPRKTGAESALKAFQKGAKDAKVEEIKDEKK